MSQYVAIATMLPGKQYTLTSAEITEWLRMSPVYPDGLTADEYWAQNAEYNRLRRLKYIPRAALARSDAQVAAADLSASDPTP